MSATSVTVPVDAVRCSKCRRSVIWSVPAGIGHTGIAYCSNGAQATRMPDHLQKPVCRWEGTRVVRRADGEVYRVRELADPELSYEDQVRELFELGRRDGREEGLTPDDEDGAVGDYVRGLQQGLHERSARKVDAQQRARRRRESKASRR